MRRFQKLVLLATATLGAAAARAQVGVGTTAPDASAELEVKSTSRGFLAPRMNTSQMTAIASPATGLAVYNTDSSTYCVYTGGGWIKLLLSTASDWTTSGNDLYNKNSGNVGIGTVSPQKLLDVAGDARINGLTIGTGNLSGGFNTAVGNTALNANISGQSNVAVGQYALAANNRGGENTGLGTFSLNNNTSGSSNTAVGSGALRYTSTGLNNTAVGARALISVDTGINNTALGSQAGYQNRGEGNVFLGAYAGYNESGSNKLYIANSTTAAPLVYGDFSRKMLIVNDSLVSQYFRMKQGASDGYTLRSDGNGNASWVIPSSLYNSGWSVSGTGADVYANVSGNVGIGTNAPAVAALLEVNSTNKGVLLPRMTTAQMNAIASPVEGLTVYNTDSSSYCIYTGSAWVKQLTSLSTTTTLSQGALPYWDGSALASSPFYYDSIQQAVGLGTSTTRMDADLFNYPRMTIASNAGDHADLDVVLAENDATAAWLNLGKARGTIDHPEAVQSNDPLSTINFAGYDGVEFLASSQITVRVSGTPSQGVIPCKTEWRTTDLDGNLATRITIDDVGRVGVNTTEMGSNFEVNGSSKTTTLQITEGAGDGYLLQSDADGKASWVSPASVTATNWTLNGSDQYSTPGGNVGIGTSTPQAKLDVSGTTQTTSLRVTSGAAGGYLLQSDASGNGIWTAPSSAITAGTGLSWNGSTLNTNWTPSGNDIYTNNSGKVGIGTSNAGAKLHVYTASGSNTVQSQSGNSNAYLAAAAISGAEASTEYQTYSSGSLVNRWTTGKTTTVETGSNAGSDYFINRYDDAGSFLGQPVRITRSTGYVGVAQSSPASTLEVNGSMGMKVKSAQAAGTNNPDATGTIWIYSSGTGTITLPTASTCANRIYTIINNTGASRTISSYVALGGSASTSIANAASLQVVSDGSNWYQVK